MKRGPSPLEREDKRSPTIRPLSSPQRPSHGHAHSHSGSLSDHDRPRNPYGTDLPSRGGSPLRTASSPGSAFITRYSPLHALPSSRMTILPSPEPHHFASVGTLPPLSSTLSSPPRSQAPHIQDLQNQLSSKDHAIQNLQREYEDLSQAFERQRAKHMDLEQKLEASEIEVRELTDEKDALQVKVVGLESQVDELQRSREEARQEVTANSEQYMRIMSLTNRINAKGAEDKKRWETERAELEQRIKILEEAMVTGSLEGPAMNSADVDIDTPSSSAKPYSRPENFNPHLAPFAVSIASSETINVLRAEVARLRKRTQDLEAALHKADQKWARVKACARQMLESDDEQSLDDLRIDD